MLLEITDNEAANSAATRHFKSRLGILSVSDLVDQLEGQLEVASEVDDHQMMMQLEVTITT